MPFSLFIGKMLSNPTLEFRRFSSSLWSAICYADTGPSGFTTADGTPVWEEYGLVARIGPRNKVYAKKDSLSGNVDVGVLEIGEA